MLTHHILDSSVEPIVLDYVKDDYFAACDYFNNIYLFYSSEIANSFGWRKYKWNSKQWEDFVPMQTGERLKNIQAVVDKDDKIHIVGEDDKNIIYLGNDEKIIGKGEKPIIF